MALPPNVFTPVAQHLKKLVYPEHGVARLIVEKPFGHDLQSSRDLQRALAPIWTEDEVQPPNNHSLIHFRSGANAFRPSASTTTSAKKWSKTS
jgi:Glucose-6-phosphate dehydrogenase, NAD binding domain